MITELKQWYRFKELGIFPHLCQVFHSVKNKCKDRYFSSECGLSAYLTPVVHWNYLEFVNKKIMNDSSSLKSNCILHHYRNWFLQIKVNYWCILVCTNKLVNMKLKVVLILTISASFVQPDANTCSENEVFHQIIKRLDLTALPFATSLWCATIWMY